MKYALMGSTNPDIVQAIFENRNVNIAYKDKFLNPSADSRTSPRIYKNMVEGAELLIQHLRNGSKILILPDSDCDGMCSGAMLFNYIRFILGYENVHYILHEGSKAHGLTDGILKRVLDIKPDLFLVPDAGSSDFKGHAFLRNFGIETIVIDHHECNRYSEDALVINNQMNVEGNKTLCGAGMVLKFLEMMDELLNANGAVYLYDLASIALVADSMLMVEEETRFYVIEGLKRAYNPLIQALVKEMDNKNFETISYDLAPSINAIIRIGSEEERQELFSALTCNNEIKPMTIRGKGEVMMNTQERVNTIANRLKSKQIRMIKKVLEEEDTILINENLPFTIMVYQDEEYSSLSGLVATRLVDNYGKPALVIREKEDGTYYGSARTTKDFCNFRSYLLNTGLFKFCLGHQGAFGIGITKQNMSKLINNLLGTSLSADAYLVDKAYTDGFVSAHEIMAVGEMKDYWCKGFDKPLFYVKLIDVDCSQISIIGTNKDTIKIKNNYIDFIKFKCTQEEIENYLSEQLIDIELVGRFNINEWNGRSYPQVLIEDAEVTKKQKVDKVDWHNFNTFSFKF